MIYLHILILFELGKTEAMIFVVCKSLNAVVNCHFLEFNFLLLLNYYLYCELPFVKYKYQFVDATFYTHMSTMLVVFDRCDTIYTAGWISAVLGRRPA